MTYKRINGVIRGYLIDFDLANLVGRESENLDRTGTLLWHLSEFGPSRIRFVFDAHASGLGITSLTPGPLVFPVISYPSRTRLACHLLYRSSDLIYQSLRSLIISTALELFDSMALKAPITHAYEQDAEAVCWVKDCKRVRYSFDRWEMVDTKTRYKEKDYVLRHLAQHSFTEANKMRQEPIRRFLPKPPRKLQCATFQES